MAQQAPLSAQIDELLVEQLAAMSAVNTTAALLNAALSAGPGCSMSEIISAVSLICTFATGLPITATSIASAASAATDAGNQLASPSLSGLQTMIKDVKVISSTVGQVSSKINEISTAYNDLKKSLGGNAPDPKVDTTKFLVDQRDFDATRKDVETQIDQLPASNQKSAYKDAVEQYLNIVQTRNQQLLSYSGIAMKLAALDENSASLQSTIENLNTQRQTLQAADVSSFLDQLKKMQQKLLQGIYFDILQQSRALDYWSLTPVDPPPQFADFGAMKAILGDLMQRKVDALQAAANPPGQFTNLSTTLTVGADDQTRLSSNGSMSFYLTPEMSSFSGLARVLISSIKVDFLLAGGTALYPIRYNLEHSGYHKFLDVNGNVFEFLTPSRAVVLGFDATGNMVIQGQFAGSDWSLDSSNGGASCYVGVSPFTRWKLSVVNDSGVYQHLGSVQQLRVTMSGYDRPFA